MTQAKASVINYDCNSSIIVLATVITNVNYDRNSFIIQATDFSKEGGCINFYLLSYLTIPIIPIQPT